MNHEQCRTARAMLGWSAEQLSRKAQVGKRTILEFEARGRQILPETNRKIRALFVVNGIEFLNDELGIGIRRRLTLDEHIAR
jgi:transcriptional regulator with XRE-family HTH domain